MRVFGNADIIALDTNRERLNMALEYGADYTVQVDDDYISEVLTLTDNEGVDSCR